MYDSDMPVKGTDYKKGNFKKLADKLAAKGSRDPNALAAWIERRKYGKKNWAKIQKAGRND